MGTMSRGLIRSSHPEPVIAVTLAMTVLAWATGRAATGVVLVAAAVLTGQLSIGLSNDYIDAERDRRAGRADKPLASGAVPAAAVGAAALGCIAACIPLSLASGWRAGLAHLAAISAGWAYNAVLKRTVASFAAFVVGFGTLPAFLTLGLPGHPWPTWWALLVGALIGVGAHFANVVPDLADDLAAGVRGLPQRLAAARGESAVRAAAAAVLLAATVVLAVVRVDTVGVTALGAAAVILPAGLAVRRRLDRRGMMGVILAAALLDVTLLAGRATMMY